MLTRREVEGQLRSLYQAPQQSRRHPRALDQRRRYAQIALAFLVGLGLIGAFGGGRVRSAYDVRLVPRQSATWGEHHVTERARGSAPLFPSLKRRRSAIVSPLARETRPGAARGSASGY